MPELYTSRWTNQDLAHLEVVPVGISRGVPRWPLPYRYKLLQLLAPSRKTFALKDFKEFERAYLARLEEIGVERIATELERIGDEHDSRPLTLLCYEANPRECHRGVFAHWWEEQTGQAVPELDPEDYRAQAQLF